LYILSVTKNIPNIIISRKLTDYKGKFDFFEKTWEKI
jgi:hypothetical protein